MDAHKILFDELAWQSPQAGARFKVFRAGRRQVRILELSPEFVEPEPCTKGHAGLVLSGELEIQFADRVIRFAEGSAFLIPAGAEHAHKAQALTPLVRLFLVEDVAE